MIDINLIRREPDVVRRSLTRRNELADVVDTILALDIGRRSNIAEADTLRASRNDASKAIGALMQAGDGPQAEAQKQAVREIGDRLKALADALRVLDERTSEFMLGMPNIASDEVPDGPDDSGNVIVWEEGERRSYDFRLKPHWELSESLGITDFEGFHTRRIYNLVTKTRSVDALCTHPRIIAIIEGYLQSQIQLSSATGITLFPNETSQSLHQDDSVYPLPRPHQPLMVGTLWAIDAYTVANGGTALIPSSHTATEEQVPQESPGSKSVPGSLVSPWSTYPLSLSSPSNECDAPGYRSYRRPDCGPRHKYRDPAAPGYNSRQVPAWRVFPESYPTYHPRPAVCRAPSHGHCERKKAPAKTSPDPGVVRRQLFSS